MLRSISVMAVILSVGLVLSSATAQGQDIYVTNEGSGQYAGTIGEYTMSGGTVNRPQSRGL